MPTAFTSILLVSPAASTPSASPFPQARRKSISGGAALGFGSSSSGGSSIQHDGIPAAGFSTSGLGPLPPAFGSKSGSGGGRNGRRPRTSGSTPTPETAAIQPNMYSIVLAQTFRSAHFPVSTLRNPTQIFAHISAASHVPVSSTSATPITPTRSSISTAASVVHAAPQPEQRYVALIPLNDLAPTTKGTNAMIRERGLTPSALCFQEDLFTDKEAWEHAIQMAVEEIKKVEEKRTHQAKEVVLVAYSANPSLPQEVIDRCLQAGCQEVLLPPFDNIETVKKVQNALKAYRTRIQLSPAISTASYSPPSSMASRPASSHKNSPLSKNLPSPSVLPSPTLSALLSPGDHFPFFDHHGAPRRSSVDTGGLALALSRTSYEPNDPENEDEDLEPSSSTGTGWAGVGLSTEASLEAGREEMLAELLSEMHEQTQHAIDIQMSKYEDLVLPLELSHRAKLVDAMSGWGFRPHQLSQDDLFHCACLMFEATLLMDGLWQENISHDNIYRFLFAVRAIYHKPNPYHNYVHGLDVLQATYTFLSGMGVAPPISYIRNFDGSKATSPWKRAGGSGMAYEVLRPQDVFTLMIAAMGHDVGHPGLSNAFMKNAKTPLSQVYDDKSTLENMHCMLVVQLLRKHGMEFLFDSPTSSSPTNLISSGRSAAPPAGSVLASGPTSRIDWRDFRKLLFSTVLSTDMSLHFAFIDNFNEIKNRESDPLASRKPNQIDEDRELILQAVMKCADISNPTRPHDISAHWSTVLLAEWKSQALLETQLSLPVSVVAQADQLLQAKGQIGFIDLFTGPLFEAVADAIPEFQPYSRQCAENRALWQTRFNTLSMPGSQSLPVDNAPPTPPISVPCSTDSPFRTLLPISLPKSLIAPPITITGPEATTTTAASPTDSRVEVQSSPSALSFRSTSSKAGSETSSSRARNLTPSSQAMRAAFKSGIRKKSSFHFRTTGSIESSLGSNSGITV